MTLPTCPACGVQFTPEQWANRDLEIHEDVHADCCSICGPWLDAEDDEATS